MSDEPKRAVGGCLGSGAGGIVGVILGIGAALTWLDTQKTGTPLDLLGMLLVVPVILALGAGLGGVIGSGLGALFGHAAAAKSSVRAQSYSTQYMAKPEVTTDEAIDAEISRLNSRIAALEALKSRSTASNTQGPGYNEDMVSARQPISSPAVDVKASSPDVARARPADIKTDKELEVSSEECCPTCGTRLYQSMEFGRVVTKCANCS
jgi:hypothetical protein